MNFWRKAMIDNKLRMIHDIDINDILNYVQNNGWNEFKVNKNVAIYQKRNNNNLYQINIPLNKDLYDYDDALKKTCYIISKAHDKEISNIIFELLYPLCDVIKFKMINADISNGSVLINDAISLYENAKKMLSTCAHSYYKQSNLSKEFENITINEYLDKCRFSQTEVGSYVVSLICPCKDKNKKSLIFSEKEECENSLARAVSNKFMKDLDTIESFIRNDRPVDELILNKQIDISFLEGIMNLNKNYSNKIEISTKLVFKEQTNNEKVILDKSFVEPIEKAIKIYKDKIIPKNITITGKIKLLSSEPSIINRNYGFIKIVSIVDNKIYKIKLNIYDYNLALKDHSLGKTINVKCIKDEQEMNTYQCIKYNEMI